MRSSWKGLDGASFDLVTPEGTRRIELALPGLYNVYNALAAAALALALGASLDEIAAGLERFSAPRSAASSGSTIGDRRLLLLLIKNPAGANEAVRTLVEGGAPKLAVIALNDAIADGRDVSWIWDVDFEPLLEGLERLVATGDRAAELALRFKYGGLDESAIEVVPDLEAGARPRARADAGGGELVVLPTYTAMLALRKIVARRGHVRPVLGARRVKIRVGHLYPDYLNIYADRGNIAVLAGARAGAATSSTCSRSGSATRCRPGEHDLFYVGGGQDREQALIAPDLAAKGPALRDAVDAGVAFLAVCGGYQLLGRYYRDRYGVGAARRRPPAAAHRRRRAADDRRRPARVRAGARASGTLAGFENHAGRTILDDGAEPLGPRGLRASATTARAASRAAASGAPSARTCTGRCCRATRGSRTGCSRRRSRTDRRRPAGLRAARRRARGARPRRLGRRARSRGGKS